MSEQWRGRGEFHRFPHRIERVSVYTSVLSDWVGQSSGSQSWAPASEFPGALSSTGCWTHSRHLWLQAGAWSSAFPKRFRQGSGCCPGNTPWEPLVERKSEGLFNHACIYSVCKTDLLRHFYNSGLSWRKTFGAKSPLGGGCRLSPPALALWGVCCSSKLGWECSHF